MSYGANKYKVTQITTATPEQLLLMYYEGAIRHVRRAIACVEKGDVEGKGLAIGKAHDIVNELSNTLNFEVGGDIARDLDRLYNYMIELLVKANVEVTKEPLETVDKMLNTLLEAWREAVKEVSEEKVKA